MPERFLVRENGVYLFASPEQPKRLTVLDGDVVEASEGFRVDGETEITAPCFLVADRALVQVDSLPAFSVKASEAVSKPVSEPAKPKAKKAPATKKAPPKRGSPSKGSKKR